MDPSPTQPTYPPPQPSPLPPGAPGPLFISPPNSGMAIASLIMGIVGFVGLPLIGSIMAVIFGHIARDEIRRSQGAIAGNGFATAGLILGYVGIGMAVLIVLFVIVLVIFGITTLPAHITTTTY